jgi:hypothetical protein
LTAWLLCGKLSLTAFKMLVFHAILRLFGLR